MKERTAKWHSTKQFNMEKSIANNTDTHKRLIKLVGITALARTV